MRRLGQFANLRGGLARKWGVVFFEGGWCPNVHYDNIRTPIQFRVQRESQHLKKWYFLNNRTINININDTRVTTPVKQNKLRFSNIEINKPLPAYNVSKVRFNLEANSSCGHKLCLITLKVKCSIISMDNNITDSIIRKFINAYLEKSRTKKGALMNSSINWMFLSCLLLRNDETKPSNKPKTS